MRLQCDEGKIAVPQRLSKPGVQTETSEAASIDDQSPVELQLGQGSGRKATLDCTYRLRCGGGTAMPQGIVNMIIRGGRSRNGGFAAAASERRKRDPEACNDQKSPKPYENRPMLPPEQMAAALLYGKARRGVPVASRSEPRWRRRRNQCRPTVPQRRRGVPRTRGGAGEQVRRPVSGTARPRCIGLSACASQVRGWRRAPASASTVACSA
jgi:hypothetical protein